MEKVAGSGAASTPTVKPASISVRGTVQLKLLIGPEKYRQPLPSKPVSVLPETDSQQPVPFVTQ